MDVFEFFNFIDLCCTDINHSCLKCPIMKSYRKLSNNREEADQFFDCSELKTYDLSGLVEAIRDMADGAYTWASDEKVNDTLDLEW